MPRDRAVDIGQRLSEASENKARVENYWAHAVSMRELAATMSYERMRSECIELAAKWETLAKRLEDALPCLAIRLPRKV